MKHILVVEDEPLNAILFRKILERRAGCRVTVTEDVPWILEQARDGGVDLVILDVSLSNSRWEGCAVNGVEVCRLLKAEPRSARVPVLLATAHAMRGDAESLLAASGADGYVAKPIVDHGAFIDHVRQLMAEAA
jgi:two-component system, cell cycle response regulator DivK